jgi:S1-C subfamily serine protease
MVRRVYAGSPAYEQGLNAGDQIVALDNMRVTRTSSMRVSRRRSRAI